MNTTTLFDLNETAASAAKTSLGKDALGTESIKLEAFTAAGHDRLDFEKWQQFFADHRANYATLQTQKSPATLAALAAAKTTPAPTSGAPTA